jgi:hypothetical protein
MKHTANGLLDGAFALALAVVTLSAGACGRQDKTSDVAQDSILVKDADIAEHKSDTAAAATAALVRERGALPQAPTLTNGAPVDRSSGGTSSGTLQPPRRVNPSPVLPPRESAPIQRAAPLPTSPLTPQPATPPTPVTQPVSPQPPPVTQPPAQPSPAPKKDSSRDSVSVSR